MSDRQIFVVDGHDGCGKSTLAREIARTIGGTVVKPFGDTLGDHISWLWQHKRFDEADAVARTSIERVLQQNQGSLVFDRHWATMFTVLPERLWAKWGDPPRTVLCTADLDVVVSRLLKRGEEVGDLASHEYYLARYSDVINRCDQHFVIDTGKFSVTECLTGIYDFLQIPLPPEGERYDVTLRGN